MDWEIICGGYVMGVVQATSPYHARQEAFNERLVSSGARFTTVMLDNKGFGTYNLRFNVRKNGGLGDYISISDKFVAESVSDATDKFFEKYSNQYEIGTPISISYEA